MSLHAGVDSVVQKALEVFGRVDLLVNAAAIRRFSPLLGDGAGAADLFKINVFAPLQLSLCLARTFWRADPAANVQFNRNILNVSSTAGLFVYPGQGQALYASSKAALNHLTYHLAIELWDLGIRVNAVAPDTFPGRVSVNEVLEAMIAFDESTETGQVLPLFHPDKTPSLPQGQPPRPGTPRG
jgi:NAD(P)-dependent dehydrogenase (short-subunit alcohol dehydrogenase family)